MCFNQYRSLFIFISILNVKKLIQVTEGKKKEANLSYWIRFTKEMNFMIKKKIVGFFFWGGAGRVVGKVYYVP